MTSVIGNCNPLESMKRQLGLAVALAAGIALPVAAETVTWEARAVVGSGRQPLAKGTKQYSPAKDIVVRERPGKDGTPAWQKSLVLNDTFALSVSVYRERSLDGFGLVIYRKGDDNGFSWDWFDREREGRFVKLQGPGRVAIQTKKGPGYEELVSIEFLDDIVLRYLDDMSKPPGTHTHEILVRKGSVLRVAP